MASAVELGNPFALMMNPQGVIQAVERSERLARLKARVCRPLDRPLIPRVQDANLVAFDAEVDALSEADDGSAG
ncbi:MAG: hypothetical protein RI988_1959 [Pseudomonadota bacterium]